MNEIFVDTSAFYGLLDSTDSFHQQAVHCFQKLASKGRTLTTTNYVTLETIALDQSRLG